MKRVLCFVVFFTLVACRAGAATAPFENHLVDHPSPYLAMHGNDPVQWQAWGKDAVELARKLNRPLFISSGYFSCHWCHVMQRESYQDPALAKLLNTYFVPVKIDRELDPALDAYLIEFVRLTRGRAGWPLNVFLTPEGYPMLGMTYLPREQFLSVLTRLRDRWQSEPETLRRIAEGALEEWRGMRKPVDKPAAPRTAVAPMFISQVAKMMDELSGGFGEQNKFPMTPQLMALMHVRTTEQPHVDEFLRTTLDKMESQGLHDLVGGGFFRYVVDPDWQTPHYEKMLYGNAQLVSLYLTAATVLEDMRYRATAFETLDFMLREMWRGEYFISSFSAVDESGREGAYYLWTDSELEKLLSSNEYELVRKAWFEDGVAQSAWGKLPRWQLSEAELSKRTGQSVKDVRTRLSAIRKKMLEARAARSLPADGKGLAAWNGLALSALANAVETGGNGIYRSHGDKLANYLATKLWDGERLARALDAGNVLADGSLQDYAMVARGLQDWGRVSDDTQYSQLASRLARLAWQRFYRNGRWLDTDEPLVPMLGGKLALDDNPLPSATALITGLSLTTESLRKDKKIHEAASGHLRQVRAQLTDSVFWYASYVEWLDRE